MSTHLDDVTHEALALPPRDRLTIALALWESLTEADRSQAFPVDPAVLAEVRRRDRDLSDDTARGRMHEDVMAAARNSLR